MDHNLKKIDCSFHLYCKSGSQPQPSLPPRLCPPPPPPLAFLLHAPSAQPAQARGMSCVCAVELHLSYLDALQLHSRSCKHHRWGPRTDTNTPTWWQREVTPKGALPIAVCHTSATREEPGKPKHPPQTKNHVTRARRVSLFVRAFLSHACLFSLLCFLFELAVAAGQKQHPPWESLSPCQLSWAGVVGNATAVWHSCRDARK